MTLAAREVAAPRLATRKKGPLTAKVAASSERACHGQGPAWIIHSARSWKHPCAQMCVLGCSFTDANQQTHDFTQCDRGPMLPNLGRIRTTLGKSYGKNLDRVCATEANFGRVSATFGRIAASLPKLPNVCRGWATLGSTLAQVRSEVACRSSNPPFIHPNRAQFGQTWAKVGRNSV